MASGHWKQVKLIKKFSINSIYFVRILAVFESVEEGPKSWQIAVQLYANQPTQSMPFTSLLNISQGHKPIIVDQIGECEQMDGNIKSIQLEVKIEWENEQ